MADKALKNSIPTAANDGSGELFPELVKKPSAESSSGVRQTELIMQQAGQWYEQNVLIQDASRDTLTDEESLQAELNSAIDKSENYDNPEYLKNIFERINKDIISPVMEYFNKYNLTHLQKTRLAKKTQSEILGYLKVFYSDEYRKHICIATLDECVEYIRSPDWKSLNCVIDGQNTLKTLLQ